MPIEILSVSTKGQVVLPQEIRKELSLAPGDKLVAYFYDGSIVLKRLDLPDSSEFEKEAKKTMEFAKKERITEKDIDRAIAEVRKEKKK